MESAVHLFVIGGQTFIGELLPATEHAMAVLRCRDTKCHCGGVEGKWGWHQYSLNPDEYAQLKGQQAEPL